MQMFSLSHPQTGSCTEEHSPWPPRSALQIQVVEAGALGGSAVAGLRGEDGDCAGVDRTDDADRADDADDVDEAAAMPGAEDAASARALAISDAGGGCR